MFDSMKTKKKTDTHVSVRYGWDREIRTPEMTGSEPVALPLGYIPTGKNYNTIFKLKCNTFLYFFLHVK